MLGISKVMTLSCTYDHRIIQGAESGMFLGRVQALLDGKDGFYEEVFNHLRMPHMPVRWETDRKPALPGMNAARHAEIAKEAGIMQMINAYRVRGHLIADLDPLGAEPSYHPNSTPKPTASPSGISTANSSPAASARPSAKARPKPSPPCAKSWRPCARPTAAKSAAST